MADIKTLINDQKNEKQREAKDRTNEELSTKEDANWQLQKSLSESLLFLYENKLWTDVSFRCKDHDDGDLSDRIKAHRNILAARSPVFQAMFYGPCANGKEEQELLTVEAEIFDLAVRYIYSEETDLTEDLAPKVMEIGHMYQISGLVNYCAEYLETDLRHDNACEILELALFYDLEKLRDSACTVIDRNASEIIQSESLLQLSVSCLTYILKGDLFFEEEQKIVEAASRWAQHKLKISSSPVSGENIRKVLGDAFYNLRIPTLNIFNFLSCTKGKGYYTVKEIEDIIQYINDQPVEENAQRFMCHSVVKRIPMIQTINVPHLMDAHVRYSSIKLQCCVLLHVSKSCILRSVELEDIVPYKGFVNGPPLGLMFPPRTFNDSSQGVSELVNASLIGKLYIEKKVMEDFFRISSVFKKVIYLKKPFTLRKREVPYTMVIELKSENSSSHAGLQATENPRKTTLPSFQLNDEKQNGCLVGQHELTCTHIARRGSIDVAYCNNSEHVNLIKSIEIRNISNR